MIFNLGFQKTCEEYGIKVSDALVEQLKRDFDSKKDSAEKYRKKQRFTYGRRRDASEGKTPEDNMTAKHFSSASFDSHDSESHLLRTRL